MFDVDALLLPEIGAHLMLVHILFQFDFQSSSRDQVVMHYCLPFTTGDSRVLLCRIIIIIWDLLAQHDLMNRSLGVMPNGAVQHC